MLSVNSVQTKSSTLKKVVDGILASIKKSDGKFSSEARAKNLVGAIQAIGANRNFCSI